MSTIIPPFGLTAPQQAAYQLGYSDGAAPVITPAPVPTPAANPIDKSYPIANGGIYPTLAAAMTQALKDKAQWPAFHFAPGQTFVEVCSLVDAGFLGMTIDGGTATTPISQCAKLTSDATGNGASAIAAIGTHAPMPNVQIRNLQIVAAPSVAQPNPPQAIFTNNTSNFMVDRVAVTGFAIGFTGDGGSGTSVTNSGFFLQSAPHLGKSQGIFLQNSQGWTIDGNIIFHAGWSSADYADTANAGNLVQLNHGIYVNNDSGLTSDGAIDNNICCYCSSSAINSRVGGNYCFNVFVSDGLAADVVIEGATGNVSNSIFFGPPPSLDAPPNYGGGIHAYSTTFTASNNTFFSNAKTPLNAAITLDLLPGTKAVSATITGMSGLWEHAAITAAAGRIFTSANIDLHVPAPTQAAPHLTDFYGCTEDQLQATLFGRIGMNDAPLIVNWGVRSWAAMKQSA